MTYAIATVIILYVGHILSLYSSIVYINPDRMEHETPRLSGFRQRHLAEILKNPRITLQMTILCKSFLLVLISLLAVLAANDLVLKYGFRADIGYPIAFFVAWVLYLIFIEILPRRRVLRLRDRYVIRFLSLFVMTYVLFRPVIVLYGRTFARDETSPIPEEQKEDIIERAIETLAEQAGVSEPIVEADEKEMIGQIFQLDVTEVREIMVPRIDIKGIDKNSSVEEIRKLTKEYGFSRYPIYDESLDSIIGILHIKDLFTGFCREKGPLEIGAYLRKPFFVSEKKKISDLLAEFKANRAHIAIVIDEYGGTAGLVTLEDILEEIFGEIQDEHDFEEALFQRLSDNSLRIDASVSVEKMLEELNLEYENGEFETVGGLIYDLVGSVPAVNTTLRWKDILFEVERVEGQRIISVKAWVKKSGDR